MNMAYLKFHLCFIIRSTHSTVEIIYRCAEYHYKQKDTDQMLDALKHLDNFEEITDFLCKRKMFTEAVTLLKEKGQILEAATILRKQVRYV